MEKKRERNGSCGGGRVEEEVFHTYEGRGASEDGGDRKSGCRAGSCMVAWVDG